MIDYLLPDIYVNSIFEIPLDSLYERNIRALILDLDNTVTEWNSSQVRPEVVEWVRMARARGFKLCLASNNSRARVDAVARSLNIPYVYNAGKPRRRAFRHAMKILECAPGETAVIGDQVFTDVLGGNRLHLLTVLVVPMNPREFIGTRIVRLLERMILRKIKRTEVNNPGLNGPGYDNEKSSGQWSE